MHTYFKPLRRKVGVFMLVMACVFGAGWVRGISSVDQLFYSADDQNLHVIVSCPQEIGWMRVRELKAGQIGQIIGLPVGTFWWNSINPKHSNMVYPLADWSDPTWCKWFGLRLGTEFSESLPSLREERFLIVSYWSIVIPLMLLSACLLLSRPRVAKPTPISQPFRACETPTRWAKRSA